MIETKFRPPSKCQLSKMPKIYSIPYSKHTQLHSIIHTGACGKIIRKNKQMVKMKLKQVANYGGENKVEI